MNVLFIQCTFYWIDLMPQFNKIVYVAISCLHMVLCTVNGEMCTELYRVNNVGNNINNIYFDFQWLDDGNQQHGKLFILIIYLISSYDVVNLFPNIPTQAPIKLIA